MNFSPDILASVETFFCRMYGQDDTNSIDMVRAINFPKSTKPEALPPTKNALEFHAKRAHYQSHQCLIWKTANVSMPELPEVVNMRWTRENAVLVTILMSLDQIPKVCIDIVSCSCRTRCQTQRCKCRKARLPCTSLCGCRKGLNVDCFNVDN